MTNAEMIFAIADGTLSVSRIKRIVKAIYGVEITPDEILRITIQANIVTPKRVLSERELENNYPDQWSILLEACSFWVRVRRYWGDKAAIRLCDRIQLATIGQWRSLKNQFPIYTDSGIFQRQDIDLEAVEISVPTELESLYPWNLQQSLYLQRFTQEFIENPETVVGVRFPLLSEEYLNFKAQKFKQDCLNACDRTFADEITLINYFGNFWQTVYARRGEDYYDKLKRSLVGNSNSNHPFYSVTEKHFRHFLHNLQGFQTKSPWRVIISQDPLRQLPMPLEGALFKYGWMKLKSVAVIGIISPKESLPLSGRDSLKTIVDTNHGKVVK